jgi:hypothetical protein
MVARVYKDEQSDSGIYLTTVKIFDTQVYTLLDEQTKAHPRFFIRVSGCPKPADVLPYTCQQTARVGVEYSSRMSSPGFANLCHF